MKKITTTYKEFFNLMKTSDNSFYIKTNKEEFTPILDCLKKQTSMRWISFEDGYTIECADNHVFMGIDGGEVFVKDLVIHSRIMSLKGNRIVSSIKKSKNTDAYDISIEAPHWYVNDKEGIIHHNTSAGLQAMKAYLTKYEDAYCLYYDTEFGAPPEYIESSGVDTSRVIHIPIKNLEELTFNIVGALENVNRGDHVFIFIDSIGNVASKREVDNAEEGNSASDMSRAAKLKSLFRIITPIIKIKNIPCWAINHVYQTMSNQPQTVMGGGSGPLLSADTVIFITRCKERDADKELVGFSFNYRIEKSRFVKEGSVIPIEVTFEDGISRYSGLFDLARESGHVISPTNGWYQRCEINDISGEVLTEERKYRKAELNNREFWLPILKSKSFNFFVEKKFKMSNNPIMEPDETFYTDMLSETV